MFLGLIGVCLAAAVCAIGWRIYQLLVARGRQQEIQERSSLLIEDERRILELVVKASLKEVLDSLTSGIERMAPGCFCSILLLDEDSVHLRAGSGGGLPDEYIRSVDGIPTGPDVWVLWLRGFPESNGYRERHRNRLPFGEPRSVYRFGSGSAPAGARRYATRKARH